MKTNSTFTTTCVVCGNKIPFTVIHRKYCRSGNCRELFKRLKRHWLSGNISSLSDEDLKIFKKLKKEGTFENSIKKTKK